MSEVADHPGPARDRITSDIGRETADLLLELRSTMAPVMGYLELLAKEGQPGSADQHLEWVVTIERRLHVMRELSDQIERICAVVRDRGMARAATPSEPAHRG